MELRKHQADFLDKNPDRALLYWCMRAGKSLAAKLWIEHPRRNTAQVVVCKKSNKKEWKGYCPNATVLSKEEFKRDAHTIDSCSAIIVDEAHHFAAPLFVPRERSALAESLYNFINQHDPHVLLLTGTPLTNKPASLHTLLCYIGHVFEWKLFRDKYYRLQHLPFLPHPAWMPIRKWRHRADRFLHKYADTVTLEECAPYLPPVTEEVIQVTPGKYPYAEDEDESWVKDHRGEQYEKVKVLRELGEKYRKLIVVCKYIEQMEDLEKKLSKQKPVYVLNGKTKDQEGTIKEAQEDPDCFLLVQAAMGEGYEGYMFDAMVFASMDHRWINYQQMYSRLVSLDHVKPRMYYFLLAKGARDTRSDDKRSWDRKIYRYVVEESRDFTAPTKKDINKGEGR